MRKVLKLFFQCSIMELFCFWILLMTLQWSNVAGQNETESGKSFSSKDFKEWRSLTIKFPQIKHDRATVEIKNTYNIPANQFFYDKIDFIDIVNFNNFTIKFQIDDNTVEQTLAELKTQEFKNLISCTEYTVNISFILNGTVVSTEDREETVLSQDFKTPPDNSLKPTLELLESSTTSLTLNMTGADSRCTIISKKVTCKMHRDGKEIPEDSLDPIIIKNLIPGKEYNCIPEVIYKNCSQSVVGDTFSFNTNKSTLILNPGVHHIEVNIESWSSKAKIFLNANLIQIRDENKVGFIDNLDMSTSYTICLSIDDYECPRKVKSCQDCQTVTTLLGVPFPPENIRFEENNSNLTITWNQPKNYSGESLQYKIEWEGQCRVNNQNCTKTFSCKVINTFTQTNAETTITKVNPYWDYTIKVFTVNAKGQSNATVATYQTSAVVKNLTIINIIPRGKQIDIEYEPHCPYTGPLSFTFRLNGPGKQQEQTKNYSLEANQIPSKTISFNNLSPTKSYTLNVITTLLDNPLKKEIEILDISTNQIPPEGIPKIKRIKVSEKSITIEVTKPDKTYEKPNEALAYYIKATSKCVYSDKTCNEADICTSTNYELSYSTNEQSFMKTFSDLLPLSENNFSLMVSNKAGNGTWSEWSKINTTAFVKKPTIINIKPGGKQIDIEYEPYCPYTGPLSFTFKLEGPGNPQDQILVYNLEENKTPSKNILFDNLIPTKQYLLKVITSLLYGSSKTETETHTISTNQIPPEGIPTIEKGEVTENSIKIKVIKPDNTFENTSETLTFYIEASSTCAYSDGRCSGSDICTLTTTQFSNTTNDYSFELTFPGLLPFSKNNFRSMVSNNAGNGTWSKWLEVNTTQMSLETLDALKTNFRFTTGETNIDVMVDPICPYRGPYIWTTCLYQSLEVKTIKTMNYSNEFQTFDTNYVFSSLEYGQNFDVCVIHGTPIQALEACNNTCVKDVVLVHGSCQCNIATKCHDLPQPTKAPQQRQWLSTDDDFNPFKNIKIKMEENTFDGTKSGLKLFKIKYFREGHNENLQLAPNLKCDQTSHHVLEGFIPGEIVQLSIVGFACRNQKKETPKVTMSTETFEPGKIKLVEDGPNQIKSYKNDDKWKMQVTITETKKNIKYAGIKSYTFGEEVIQMENLFNNTILEALNISDGGRCLETNNSVDQMMCTIEIDYFDGTLDVTIATQLSGSEVVTVSISNQTSQTLGTSSTVLLVLLALVIVVGIYAGVHYVKNGQLPLAAKISARRRSSTAPKTEISEPVEMTPKPTTSVHVQDTLALPTITERTRPLTKAELLQLVEEGNDFNDEYKRLTLMDQKFIQPIKTTVEAKKWNGSPPGGPVTQVKMNRYSNILPYDDTRVVLSKPRAGCDYINANWIRGYKSNKDFIGTQGPLSTSVPHFWQMILENNVQMIIMLTKLAELKKPGDQPTPKCNKYWPSVGRSFLVEDLKVTTISEETISTPEDTVKRTLTVTRVMQEGKEPLIPLTVTQIHYSGWPDYGAPEKTQDLLDLHKIMREQQKMIEAQTDGKTVPPIVVHCSAGVGRTGTLIGLDTLAQAIDTDQPTLDVFGTIFNMRQDRCHMVQKAVQYKYLYNCVAEYIEQSMEMENPSDEISQLDEQYIYYEEE